MVLLAVLVLKVVVLARLRHLDPILHIHIPTFRLQMSYKRLEIGTVVLDAPIVFDGEDLRAASSDPSTSRWKSLSGEPRAITH